MDKKGDKILTAYWFVIIFIVAGAIFYMVSAFYGAPFDIRNTEGKILSNQIANCITDKGYINEQIFSSDFQTNFLSNCNITFNTEDFSDWKTNQQYYAEVSVYKFNSHQEYDSESQNYVTSIYGDQLVGLSFGNPNLKTNWELTLSKPSIFSFLAPQRKVSTIVIHATETSDVRGALQSISERGLSIHYLIDRDGTIYSSNNNPTSYTNALVPENVVAQHAGCVDPTTNSERPTCSVNCASNGLINPSCQFYVNSPPGDCCIEGFNPKSIGIELVNIGDACTDIHYKNSPYCQNAVTADGKQWESYSQAQINALANLVANIASRYNVPIDRVHIIGHDQIAAFKPDPGPQFPWDNFMQELSNTPTTSPASNSQTPTVVQGGQQQRSFYAINKNGNQYIVQILTLVGKTEKNV